MRNKKMLKIMFIICILIIFIELVIMAFVKVKREHEITYFDGLNDMVLIDNGYVGVGESNFKNSKFVDDKTYLYNDKKIVSTRGKIAIYDSNMKIIKEMAFDSEFDSTFYSLLKVTDGYIAVGSIVKNTDQIKADTRDALIVKYDNNLNVVWSNTYSVLSDTEFYKIIEDDENYVVIGQSIYENMEMGNHITGGGIIVRYDKDGNLVAHNNYGGNKSGIFNDIIKVNDGYIVCGRDATNYGIVVKFKKDFNRDDKDNGLISKKVMWQRTYSNTDMEGFTSMVKVNDILYVAGALNISDDKDKDGNIKFKYNAGVVLYDVNGKYQGNKIILNSDKHDLFNSITSDNKYLYLTGLIDVDSSENKKSMIIKYDLNGNIVEKKYFENENNTIFMKIDKIDDKYLVIGASDTKCSMLTGCDYESIINFYNEDLKAIN